MTDISDEIVGTLEDQARLIKERGKTHGPIVESYKRMACILSALHERPYKPSDIADVLMVMKRVRQEASPENEDHPPDGANYNLMGSLLRSRGL